MNETASAKSLRHIYRSLHRAYGPQHWWPARNATEVVVGAILTQNTSWKNVEKAVQNLRAARALSWPALRKLDEREIARLIRPSGVFRVKAARLKAFVDTLFRDYGGSLRSMCGGNLESARRRLLAVHGIGPETADAILLYAAGRPTFVVDAYTKRVLRRHRLIDARAGYEAIRALFHTSLPRDEAMFNEYHALLVTVGKKHCRAVAQCEGCPLVDWPHDASL